MKTKVVKMARAVLDFIYMVFGEDAFSYLDRIEGRQNVNS
jgi:hypothetical protein